jgi:hypothetical protein
MQLLLSCTTRIHTLHALRYSAILWKLTYTFGTNVCRRESIRMDCGKGAEQILLETSHPLLIQSQPKGNSHVTITIENAIKS